MPVETTRCSSVYPLSFYFDSETGRCAQVTDGCSLSENAFATLESCRQDCSEHLASSVTDAAARGLPDVDLCSISSSFSKVFFPEMFALCYLMCCVDSWV